MYTHSPNAAPRSWQNAPVDTSRTYSEVYFSYSSNMSPATMQGRYEKPLFCGLAKLVGWKFTISTTGFANIKPGAETDAVYGALYFLSPRDKALLDEAEEIPELSEPQWHEVTRVGAGGKDTEQKVKAMVYVDVKRPEEGTISPLYVVWLRKALRDAKPHGLPQEYVEKCVLPWLPELGKDEDEGDLQPVRMTFSKANFE